MSDEATIEFEEWRDNLPHELHVIVINRACGDVGYERELRPEGGLTVDGDLEDEDFLIALHQRFLQMYVHEGLNELAVDGLIVPDSIDPESGEILYRVVA